MILGLVIQNFMRMNICYMVKFSVEAIMRADKHFENLNNLLKHAVYHWIGHIG